MQKQISYSGIFLDYIEVLRSATQHLTSAEELSKLLVLPETVWNAVVMDEARGTAHAKEILNTMNNFSEPQKTSGRKMVEYWIQRKKENFAEYKWSVTHSVRKNPSGGLIIQVEARDLQGQQEVQNNSVE